MEDFLTSTVLFRVRCHVSSTTNPALAWKNTKYTLRSRYYDSRLRLAKDERTQYGRRVKEVRTRSTPSLLHGMDGEGLNLFEYRFGSANEIHLEEAGST